MTSLPSAAAIDQAYADHALRPMMQEKRNLTFLIPLCWSIPAIAALTWVAFSTGISAAGAGFLYLVCVVFATAQGGFWTGTLTSIFATLCLDYFFFPPVLHFDIDNPMDWLALGTFQVTALVISRLQDRAQAKASEAMAERRDSERLYKTAREIMLFERSCHTGPRVAALIQETFCLEGVVLFDTSLNELVRSGTCSPEMDQGARDACSQNSEVYDSKSDTWYCLLRTGSRVIGGLAMRGSGLQSLTAKAIASLCAVSIDRVRALESEARVEAARQVEQMRTAVLEALAHQIKTPLCVIQAASSGLPALGPLSESQTELATAIDEQATKLDGLISRLLGTAALDSSEIKPRLAPVLLSKLIETVINSIPDHAQRKRVHVVVEENEEPVLADGEIIMTALSEIVDNALKYSAQGSQVTATVTNSETEIRLAVSNQGLVIPLADRTRIFERFYRTQEAQARISGTGLGLSIVKRITEAHHGRIWVESDAEHGTVFSLALPRAA